jgi:hypothetical protein
MERGRFRVAVVNSHPIQYFAPLYTYLSRDEDIDVTAVYCSDSSLRGGMDPGFGQPVTWNVDLLAGYRSIFLGRRARDRIPRGFFSLVCPEIWRELRATMLSGCMATPTRPTCLPFLQRRVAESRCSFVPRLISVWRIVAGGVGCTTASCESRTGLLTVFFRLAARIGNTTERSACLRQGSLMCPTPWTMIGSWRRPEVLLFLAFS